MVNMKISSENFQQSSSWIKRNARPLEAARWEYLFEGTSRDNVIKYLSAFQNDDGGFGNGIEPDFWSPYSSPMATWVAGQILMEIEASSDEAVVQSMLKYLANTYQKDSGMWSSVLPEYNQYPHAPWWHWEEGVQDNWMFNPSAELAAFLVYWSPQHSETAQIGWSVIENALNHLFSVDEMDQHEINNYQRLLDVLKLHETTFANKFPYSLNEVSDVIMSLAEGCIEWDVSAWSTGYKPLPLDLIASPEHPLYEKYSDLVQQNLLFYIETLTDEGTWDVTWNWESYPEAFAIASRYWQGILTVDRYKIFQSFGLLS